MISRTINNNKYFFDHAIDKNIQDELKNLTILTF